MPRITPPDFVANFDSATAMARANAMFLHGEDFPALGEPPILKPFAARANLLPKWLRTKLYIFSGWNEAVKPKKIADTIRAEELSEWVADMYPDRRYPAVAIGSSNGAATHLWCALGIPWLPQTAMLPIRQSVHPDDPTQAMEIAMEPAAALLEHNPEWQLHHMHDANQDRLMVRTMTYFRVKRRELGEAYARFLRERLEPGGTIIVSDCRRRWGVTRISDRHVFQHGALGGATEQEFHDGGTVRVRDYLERHGSSFERWDGPEPDDTAPEAEWGFEEALMDDLHQIAQEEGYRIRRLVHEEPEDVSPFVADLHRWWYDRMGIPASRLLIESFIVMEPYWAQRTGSVPYWMKFNMRPNLRRAHDYLDDAELFDDIGLMLFNHGVDAVGLPSAGEWLDLVGRARHDGRLLGGDLGEFPMDYAQFSKYHTAVKEIEARYPQPPSLTLAELDEFIDAHGDHFRITWEDELASMR